MRPPNKALLFYLTWINPVVALGVFALCSWLPLTGITTTLAEGGALADYFEDDFLSMYFIGKGVFCCFLLWLFGLFFRFQLLKAADRGAP